MPECEICGEEAARVYACTNCGILFCKDCGSPSKTLCIDCESSEEEEDWENEPQSYF